MTSAPLIVPQPVLVVDDDEMMTSLLHDYLESMGVTDIESAGDGATAWDLMSRRTYGLVVLDWKLPGLTGLTLFNRVRQLAAYNFTPICISSGLLSREDCFLLEEYPTTRLLEKPYTEALFVECVGKLVQEASWLRDYMATLNDLVKNLSAGDAKTLASLLQLLKASPNPAPVAINAAKVMRERRHLQESEALLRGLLEQQPHSVLALSELGKVLHQLGRHAESRVALARAQDLSPKNLQRLCLLGEVELIQGDSEAAAKHFKQALLIDADSAVAQAGLSLAETANGLDPEQRTSSSMLKSMAGFLNITAINFVKEGQHGKAIEQYTAAFNFLNEDRDRARLAFNLGLAYLRWQRPADAAPWFQRSLDLSKGAFTKARDYLARVSRLAGDPAATVKAPVEGEEIFETDAA